MRVFSGRVHNGAIVPEDGVMLPEGMQVTVLLDNGDDSFEVSPEQEEELLEATAGVERGETVREEDLLARLRR